jgi:hypothetical protein
MKDRFVYPLARFNVSRANQKPGSKQKTHRTVGIYWAETSDVGQETVAKTGVSILMLVRENVCPATFRVLGMP